jgi:hypothetical protein
MSDVDSKVNDNSVKLLFDILFRRVKSAIRVGGSFVISVVVPKCNV